MTTLKEKIKNLSDGINEMASGEMRPVTKEFFKTMLEDYKRHAELEEKLEQGTMIELPCKIGETVYIVDTYFYEHKEKCQKCEYFYEGDSMFRDDDCCFYEESNGCENKNCLCISEMTVTKEWLLKNLDLFGKAVFLTEAEAQERLKP